MNHFILCFITMSIICSCSSNRNLDKPGKTTGLIDTINRKAKDGIRFAFRADPVNAATASFAIHATLYNDHTDTAYFLSTTCEGEQYALHYDTSKFELSPRIFCNAIFPEIIKIAPKGQHHFDTHFRIKNAANNIKLGFDFYAVDRSFNKTDAKQINIFNRPADQQNMIWADEKNIESVKQ